MRTLKLSETLAGVAELVLEDDGVGKVLQYICFTGPFDLTTRLITMKSPPNYFEVVLL